MLRETAPAVLIENRTVQAQVSGSFTLLVTDASVPDCTDLNNNLL